MQSSQSSAERVVYQWRRAAAAIGNRFCVYFDRYEASICANSLERYMFWLSRLSLQRTRWSAFTPLRRRMHASDCQSCTKVTCNRRGLCKEGQSTSLRRNFTCSGGSRGPRYWACSRMSGHASGDHKHASLPKGENSKLANFECAQR